MDIGIWRRKIYGIRILFLRNYYLVNIKGTYRFLLDVAEVNLRVSKEESDKK